MCCGLLIFLSRARCSKAQTNPHIYKPRRAYRPSRLLIGMHIRCHALSVIQFSSMIFIYFVLRAEKMNFRNESLSRTKLLLRAMRYSNLFSHACCVFCGIGSRGDVHGTTITQSSISPARFHFCSCKWGRFVQRANDQFYYFIFVFWMLLLRLGHHHTPTNGQHGCGERMEKKENHIRSICIRTTKKKMRIMCLPANSFHPFAFFCGSNRRQPTHIRSTFSRFQFRHRIA